MKNLLFIFVGVLLLTAGKPVHQSKEKYIDIAKAVSEKKIDLTIAGNDESPNYYQPILAHLKNLSSEEIIINIKNGQLFIMNLKSKFDNFQDVFKFCRKE